MIDETLFEAEEKMEQGRRGRQGGLRDDPHRSGQPGHVRQDPRRLLRRADPAAAAGVVPDAGGPHHPRSSPFDKSRDGRDREGDPRLRPRASTPTTTAHSHPRHPAAADRGAPPGVRSSSPRHKGEDAKVSIRNIRRKAKEELDRIVKDGEVGEDEGTPRREGARGADQEARRRRRRPAQAQGSRAARGLRCPFPAHEHLSAFFQRAPGRRPGGPTPPTPSPSPTTPPPAPPTRAGRNLPAAIGVGVGLGALVVASLFIRKEGFLVLATAAVCVGVWELRAALGPAADPRPARAALVGAVGDAGRGVRRRAARR